MSPKRTATDRSASATTICRTDSGLPSPPSRSFSSERRSPSGGSTRSASSASIGTPVSTVAITMRVVEQVAAAERPVLHPVERGLLGRRAVVVRIDPHLAEEDAIGPGNRLLAEVDGLSARVAVAEAAQALLDLLRRAAGAALVHDPAQAELGELRLEVVSTQPVSIIARSAPALPVSSSCADSGLFASN